MLRASLQKRPGNVDMCQRLVKLLRDRNELSQAFEVLAGEAAECLEQGRFSGAIGLMETMLEVRPEHIQAYVEIGKTHLQIGRFEQAVESFGKAFDGYLKQEKMDRCQEVLRLMGRVDPESVVYLVRKAEWLARSGEVDEALTIFRECARILENGNQPQDFLEVGERMLELDPSLTDIRAKVGETLIAEANAFVNYGLFNKAVKALCRAIQYAPNQVDTYMTLAQVLVRGGRRSEALEMVVLAARKVDGDLQKRDLLLLARELSQEAEQIAAIAEELGVDLQEDNSEGDWPFPKEETEGLGTEDTSPIYSLEDFTREITREHGPVIGGESVAKNLMDLLHLADGISKVSNLSLFAKGESEPRAEILVGRGRVLLGVRIEGECFIDEEAQGAQPELVSKLETNCDSTWEGKISSAAEREFFRDLTARALIEIATIAVSHSLGTTVDTIGGSSALPDFSTASLLMGATSGLCPPVELITYLQQMGDFGDECWLMVRPTSNDQFLPLSYSGSPSVSFLELRTASSVAGELATQIEPISTSEHPVGISFVFPDGAWGAVIAEQAVLLARSANNGIGQLLGQMRQITGVQQ